MSDQRTPLMLARIALDAALKAGDLLMERPTDLQIQSKSSAVDIVTVMDKASEDLLVELLVDPRFDDGVVGEEGANRDGSGVRWVIDPLDGTVNYTYGLPSWSVSVAAKRGAETLAGVVHAPELGRTWWAAKGHGAWLRNCEGEQVLRVGNVTDLAMALIGTGFSYDTGIRAEQGLLVAELLPQVRDIRRYGSAAIDLCLVASGNYDAYFERGLNEWDAAAGQLIAQEAGARTSFDQVPAQGGFTMAANPVLFDKLSEALAAISSA